MTALELETILYEEGADKAIAEVEKYISTQTEELDFAYYILGNAYRKKGDWQGAINNYLQAMAIEEEMKSLGAKEFNQLLRVRVV